jgi:carbon monoxide dehydrogenase subunit G
MKFENGFVVQAPIDEVWAALLDVERVAPCMPGAEVLERLEDDAYRVGVKVKVGPMSMTYRGEVRILERDDQARRATMRVRAKEARGQGAADAHARMHLSEEADGTHATIETEVQLSGKAAAMGRGVVADVSAKLVETFADNLAAMLAPVAAAGPGPLPPQSAAVPPPSPPQSPPPPAQTSLPVGKIAAAVITGRLGNPRTLLAAGLTFAVVCLAIGFLIGKAT